MSHIDKNKFIYISLKKMFESDITASHLDSKLKFLNRNSDPLDIKEQMTKYGFDVFGTVDDEGTKGYVENSFGNNERSSLNFNNFDSSELITDSTPLIKIFRLLREEPHRLFVLYENQIQGIITISDLQKIPVRIFLFGLISLLEMKMTQIIRNRYKNDEWFQKIGDDGQKAVNKEYERQKLSNENIGFLDCLQLSHKATIIVNTDEVLVELGFTKNKLKKVFGSIINLRNGLAHSRDLIDYNSSKIIDNAIKMDKLVEKMTKIENEDINDQDTNI